MSDEAIISKIRNMIYDRRFADRQVFTKAYALLIYLKTFEGNRDLHSAVFFDYDRVDDVNNEKGFEETTEGMKNIMNMIAATIPDDAHIFTLGGDEFGIVITLSESIVNEYIQYITTKIRTSPEEVTKTLSITARATDTGSVTTSSLNPVEDSLIDASFKVGADKLAKKDVSSLNTIIGYAIKKAFKVIRTDKNKLMDPSLSIEEGRAIIEFNQMMVKLLLELLYEETRIDINQTAEGTMPYIQGLTGKEAKLVHNYFVNGIYEDDLSSELLNRVFESLRREPTTGLSNRLYAETSLFKELEEKDKDLSLVVVDTGGIKISNTLDGYLATDKKISIISDEVVEALKHSVRSSQDDEDKNRDWIIDLGGGLFVIVLRNCDKTQLDIIRERIDKNVSIKLAENHNNHHLNLSSIGLSLSEGESIQAGISRALYGLDEIKNKQKIMRLDSESVKEVFKLFLKPCVDEYIRVKDNRTLADDANFIETTMNIMYDIIPEEDIRIDFSVGKTR